MRREVVEKIVKEGLKDNKSVYFTFTGSGKDSNHLLISQENIEKGIIIEFEVDYIFFSYLSGEKTCQKFYSYNHLISIDIS